MVRIGFENWEVDAAVAPLRESYNHEPVNVRPALTIVGVSAVSVMVYSATVLGGSIVTHLHSLLSVMN